MTGWMLTEQADLFGMGMDALTPAHAERVLEEADREAPSAGGEPTLDDNRDAEASAGLQEPFLGAEPADLDDDVGVLFEGAVGRAAEWLAYDQVERDPGVVPTTRFDEFVCAGCFLIWHRGLLADASRRLCHDCSDDMAVIRHNIRSAEAGRLPTSGPSERTQLV